MRAVNRGDSDSAFRLIDNAHIGLIQERDSRAMASKALRGLAADEEHEAKTRTMTVGELAHRINVHPATLRTWETAGILGPTRGRNTGYREYGPEDITAAEIARQLRGGGYRLQQIKQFLQAMTQAGGAAELELFLDAWQARLSRRSRDLLTGAAQLDSYLNMLGD